MLSGSLSGASFSSLCGERLISWKIIKIKTSIVNKQINKRTQRTHCFRQPWLHTLPGRLFHLARTSWTIDRTVQIITHTEIKSQNHHTRHEGGRKGGRTPVPILLMVFFFVFFYNFGQEDGVGVCLSREG